MSNNKGKTEIRLRFRINMLLAERDMSIKQLYDRVKALGSDISSSHFYRQMKPYHSPMRMDLLTYVVRALEADPAELFDLVEVAVDEGSEAHKLVGKAAVSAEQIDVKAESEKVKKARKTARQKRELAMLGTKISVLPEQDES
jgi:hypothetical protein